jgi:tripartite-type tricarboxylate transporter receptor subunit TctC
MAVALTNSLRPTVFVENRGGAGGVIGAELVAQSPADGYTLMLLPSALVANASLYPKLTFQITRDFASVSG